MDKKHKVVRRLLVISAVVVSLVLICSAQSEDDSHAHGDRLCQPGTDNCPNPIHDPKPGDRIHAGDSLVEASGKKTEIVCLPGTSKCNNPKINLIISDPTEEAGTEKGVDTSSELKPLNVCDPITRECPGTHPGSKKDTSEKEDEDYASGESKYESSEDSESESEPSPEASSSKRHKPTNLMTCSGPPDNRICTDKHHGSFFADDASADSQSSESDSSSDASPPNSRMICTGLPNEGHDCSGSHPSFVSESDEDGFAVNVHREENTISPLVCDPTADGTKCEGPHHAFGIAQPGVEAA